MVMFLPAAPVVPPSPLMNRHAICFAAVLTLTCAGGARAQQPVDPAGKWAGAWNDIGTGHHGPLHAKIVRVDECTYRATFHGRFRKAIPFIYALDLRVTGQDGEHLVLAGTLKMPLTGQVMQLTARVSACDFDADFCSEKYHGKFERTRAR